MMYKLILSENRADDEKFSEGLAELLNRDPISVIYSKNMLLIEKMPSPNQRSARLSPEL